MMKNCPKMISHADNAIYVSPISLWEVQIKVMIGKLHADLKAMIEQLPINDFMALTSHGDHVAVLSRLPLYHQNPFDRMLIAQAISEPLHLLTHDKNVSLYSESIMLV